MKALVVFHGHGCAWYQRFLKPNFRHCLIAIEAEDYWIEIDGRAGVPKVKIQAADSGDDLAAFYRGHGLIVVETETGGAVRWPVMGRNCVGIVKALCGIWQPWVLTPHQLYKRLERVKHVIHVRDTGFPEPRAGGRAPAAHGSGG